MSQAALGAMVGVIAGIIFLRRHVVRTIEGEYTSRFPPGPDGIADGAHGFILPGTNGRGLLLLHGSGDSPQSLRYLGERLNASGYTVHAPLLPGHGRSPRAFASATAVEYHETGARALEGLRGSHEWVAVIGQSMGGALAASLARDAPGDVRALALLAPYVIPSAAVRRAAGTAWLWKWALPYIRGRGDTSVHDRTAGESSRAYGSFSAGGLAALIATAEAGRQALATLTVPTLVINSEHDNRIPRALAEEALRTLRSPNEQHWVTGCGHVLSVDYCKDRVVQLVLGFLARHAD